jgi:serine/threonine-protein phosphatase 4 regulatory subunit 1
LATQKVLIPGIEPLLQDGESVIRQHLAAQLLPLAISAMIVPVPNRTSSDWIKDPTLVPKEYDSKGYKIVTTTVMNYLNTLIHDAELDVRRAAADSLSGISLQIRPSDVPTYCLPIPIRLASETIKSNNGVGTESVGAKSKRTDEEQRNEELRITAANLLAEMGGAASDYSSLQIHARSWVKSTVLPAILELSTDPSFRIRRCAAQAMPRILGACEFEDAVNLILPAFTKLSQDDIHRVRKSTGECLADMSRALVILSSAEKHPNRLKELYEHRRKSLLPIAERLIQDPHKMVRHGMMQFLGPFMASFYPYQFSSLHDLLPSNTESDGSNHLGIVAQFFPHSSSMVSRLNSSQNATGTAPTPVHSSIDQLSPKSKLNVEELQSMLPTFIHASRMSTWSLQAVTAHRTLHPPDPEDLAAIVATLLDYFVALAAVKTGDDNTDAEMRVYCAYSFPAVVLLLGREHWDGAVRTCFHTLLNPRYPSTEVHDVDEDDNDNEPPLPVKRCLASSLHTVAHILGGEIAMNDIVGVLQKSFLNDSDDSVRLSTIRNFPALIKLISPSERSSPFLSWSELVQSEELLGSVTKKRSATNPTILNWRQRDYLARSLPDLIMLIDPILVHQHVWTILKLLLQDSVDVVRDDALWAIPVLLQSFCPDTLKKWSSVKDTQRAVNFSNDACSDVVNWIMENVLHTTASKTKSGKVPNFSERQTYCRICAAIGLALQFGDCGNTEVPMTEKFNDPVSVISDKFKSFFKAEKQRDETENGPYQELSVAEQKHLRVILVEKLLPTALDMKEDRISNVRITLMKTLQIMPRDIRDNSTVKAVTMNLVQESETWTSFGEDEISSEPAKPQPSEGSKQSFNSREKPTERALKSKNSGPVDVDEYDITRKSSVESHAETKQKDYDRLDDGETANSTVRNSSNAEETNLTVVTFESGSIGMQLEPTADESACRVCGFLDADDDTPSPARISGKVQIGDVIVKVNGAIVSSYDETIRILRAGGRREIAFRPRRQGDEPMSGDETADSDDADARRERKAAK